LLNQPSAEVKYSRYAELLPISTSAPFIEAAIDFLTSESSDAYAGAVLLAASDDALEAIARHRDQLAMKYRLDISNPNAQLTMLDKLATYQIAEAADVPTPRFWRLAADADVTGLRGELDFPLIVKPIHSHAFQKKFPPNVKFLVADDFDDLARALCRTRDAGIDVLLLEKIPGPDSALCSYYTYLDEDGAPLFDFTKRIIRRYPKNMGLATYHVTDHVEGIKESALGLFREAGLRGLANAEFKYDERDRTLKLIECNARFTAANGLLARAGLDLTSLVYNRLVGLPLPPLNHYRDNVTLWDPLRDYLAYRDLSRDGEMSFRQWVYSVMRPHVFPCFAWSDPCPALARLWRRVRKRP
jgi:predicted ATP-grasp superfamily ATP-dependent carboligase